MGAEAISLRVLEFAAPGLSPGLRNSGCDEVLYVAEGDRHAVSGRLAAARFAGDGILPAAAASACPSRTRDRGRSRSSARNPPIRALRSPSSLRARALSRCHRRSGRAPSSVLGEQTDSARRRRAVVPRRSSIRRASGARGDAVRRRDSAGSRSRPLPRVRGGDLHPEGRGRSWAGESLARQSSPGPSFSFRAATALLENTGTEEFRLLGVFYPSGSPAVRYPASQA